MVVSAPCWGGGLCEWRLRRRSQTRTEMTNGFAQSALPKGNKWVCNPFLAITHTLTHKQCWFSSPHKPVSWFISTYALKCGNLDEWQKYKQDVSLSAAALALLFLSFSHFSSSPICFTASPLIFLSDKRSSLPRQKFCLWPGSNYVAVGVQVPYTSLRMRICASNHSSRFALLTSLYK